ncbi:MAG: hypothetical protein D6803_04960 [Anaerolineae bacterium]|nr:MAG: hypothetical protein D6803_04960 [Anaerolineae bacterium]
MLSGKGFFISRLDLCERGEPQAIALRASRARLSHVIIQIAAEGDPRNRGLLAPAVRALHDQGITVWGWQFVTGYQPLEEARQAIAQLKAVPLDGLVICAEEDYKQPGRETAAGIYLNELRSAFPDLPLAFSSYRFPSYHPTLPWQVFLSYCDYNMPKVFWAGAHNPRTQLERSFNEFSALRPKRPIIPVGPAYPLGNWQPTAQEVLEFLHAAQNLGVSAVNFWHWDVAGRPDHAALWQTIAEFDWRSAIIGEPLLQRLFEALNRRDLAAVQGVYAENAVHVTPQRTIAGRAAIGRWYASLFEALSPQAEFATIAYRGTAGVRYLNWQVLSPAKPPAAPSPVDPALLQQGYAPLFQGVYYRRLEVETPRPHILHIARVDLTAPGIELVVTPREGLGSTTSAFLERYGLQLAVNGDEWTAHDDPKGLAVSQGDMYSPLSAEPTVYMSQDNRVQFGGPPPQQIWNAISGSHTLVRGGKVNPKLLECRQPDYCYEYAGRTALGVTKEGHLLLVVAEGLPLALRLALSLRELAIRMAALGARDAISLDGGGSSTMAVQAFGAARVLNMPSDGQERAVSNHLGVRARPLPTQSRQVLLEGEDTIGLSRGRIYYHFTRVRRPR